LRTTSERRNIEVNTSKKQAQREFSESPRISKKFQEFTELQQKQ